MSRSIVAKIIPETCNAFWDVLKDEFMPIPTRSTWEKIAADYDYFWQFPNCVGSIDGKHVTMQAPKNAGSLYYNYKKQHSLILLAVVDAQYNFVAVDIGGYGKQSDGSVFSNSAIGRLLKSQNLDFPANEPLRGTKDPALPFVLVGDEAFPLLENLMRPYPGDCLTEEKRVFNYRLSRARRVVESAFGILVSRFRCFRRPLLLQPKNAIAIIKGAVVLHNFLRKEIGIQYVNVENINSQNGDDKIPREKKQTNPPTNMQMLPLKRVGRRHTTNATAIREQFKNYFVSKPGAVPWQSNVVNRVQ